jgi:uncharacterized repeat protein (TIGR01451 family)
VSDLKKVYDSKEKLMKTTRFLIFGMLVLALAVPAFSSQITLIKERAVTDPATYKVGETVHFECTVENPSGNTETNTLTSIYDTLPDGSNLWLVEPGVDPPLVQDPGDSMTYYVDYVVVWDDLQYIGGAWRVKNMVDALGDDTAGDDVTGHTEKTAIIDIVNEIILDKYADREAFCEGDDPLVTYTFEVYNNGDEDIADLWVCDELCGGCFAQDPGDFTGDDGDGYLNPGETWTTTCQVTLTETTYNNALADGFGRYTDEYVYDDDDLTVEAVPPPGVSVDPPTAEICEGDPPVHMCAIVTDAVGDITYSWTKDGSPFAGDVDCIDVDQAGEYCVHIIDEETGCEADACGTLTVIPSPSCDLEAVDPPVCPSEDDNYITAIVTGGSGVYTDYVWEITAGTGWAIESGQGTDTIEYSVGVDASECATFKLTVTDENGCETTCELEVCCIGDTFCGFTQGFYGNKGGKACDGIKTKDLIEDLLAAGGPVVVGGSGLSITLNDADCIIKRLPAGGTPMALPAIGDFDDDCTGSDNKVLIKYELLNNQKRYNNVLIGQVVALTLNLRLDDIGCEDDISDLGSFVLSEEFCTEGEDGCPRKHTIPESLVGLTVAELLEAANEALAGMPNGASPSALNNAVTAVNEAFDECATVISCPTVEDCDNDCDDDFDGLIDCADPDCMCI